MTISLELDPEMEARLRAAAQSQGVPLAKAAERLLAKALTLPSGPSGKLTVAEFRDMLAAMAEGADNLPDLPTETFTRESFYRDQR
jgi:hypothetical protein